MGRCAPSPPRSIEVVLREDVRERLIALSSVITIKIGRSIKESNTDDLLEQFLLVVPAFDGPYIRHHNQEDQSIESQQSTNDSKLLAQQKKWTGNIFAES